MTRKRKPRADITLKLVRKDDEIRGTCRITAPISEYLQTMIDEDGNLRVPDFSVFQSRITSEIGVSIGYNQKFDNGFSLLGRSSTSYNLAPFFDCKGTRGTSFRILGKYPADRFDEYAEVMKSLFTYLHATLAKDITAAWTLPETIAPRLRRGLPRIERW